MQIITDQNIQNTLFAQIQSNALANGNCHWGGYKKWCIMGEEIEQALKDIFADDSLLKPTIEIVQCVECKYWKDSWVAPDGKHEHGYCHMEESDDVVVGRWDDDFCSYGERRTDG